MVLDSQEVAKRVGCCLKGSLYSGVRTVSCECDRGMVFLRGRVVSYYQKQLAQEAVARVEGVAQVINEIDVVGLSQWECASRIPGTSVHTDLIKEGRNVGSFA